MMTVKPTTVATPPAQVPPQELVQLASLLKPAKPVVEKKNATSKKNLAEPAVKKVTVEKLANTKIALKKPAVKTLAVKVASRVKTKKVAVVQPIVKPEKVKKLKMVRDSFTIPKAEYEVLGALKQRAIELAHPAKKSELLRAGIKALAELNDAAFSAALDKVPAIKTGRPASER